MSIRTTHSVVRFARPFSLAGIDGAQPAGDYEIDHDEELIDGMTWHAWRRVGTYMHLPATAARGRRSQLVTVDFAELTAALKQDQEAA